MEAGFEIPALEAPYGWIQQNHEHFMEKRLLQLFLDRQKDQTAREKALDQLVKLRTFVFEPSMGDKWYNDILYVRALKVERYLQSERTAHHITPPPPLEPPPVPPLVLELIARILVNALDVPSDCHRILKRYDNDHNLQFFTNYRTIQIYCWHNEFEREFLNQLAERNLRFQLYQSNNKLGGENYEQFTEAFFRRARPYLAWECIYPEGIDMEALSPRDVNAHIKNKQPVSKNPVSKVKESQPAKLTGKEKDHPPPPPAEVREPPSFGRKYGAIYQTGKCLGKGGFAICYEGTLEGAKKKYALKIVKSHMPQKKMEQKFQTELQIHSKMKHANIVEFYRAFAYDKCTYIVLELCPNGSLMDMVKKRKFITEPEVRFWTVQMAGAIKYMHSKGIIHRDLKMGNIFLDKDMNVKVGDFGLAALLMSNKDMTAVRRTTLCGTPNYIAPEILEKNKGGHDHAVDIWSLGIIIFAMLTGKPPFQSATAEEIYRRAREREYDWPKLNTSENYISDETKDLVSTLLQSPEMRPDPDTIVQHPFFTCGWMPQSEEITPDLRENAPSPTQFLSVGVRAGRANLYQRNLKKLCVKCEVGPWNPAQKPPTSTYREVAAEEKAGLTPLLPLAEDVVYRPFHEWLKEQAEQIKVDDEDDTLNTTTASSTTMAPAQRMPSSSRPVAQSFAAQQRARPPTSSSSTRSAIPRQTSSEIRRGQQAAVTTTTSTSRPLINIPKRHIKIGPTKLGSQVAEKVANVEERLAADMAVQLGQAEAERKSQESLPPVVKTPVSLFGPSEKLERLPGTKPDQVLEGLRRLQAELERALNSRTIAIETKTTPQVPAIVVKWVDYTNKFGLGYILSNGSVGCIFKETPTDSSDPVQGYIPPCCVLVRDAERHLQNRGNMAYVDRLQIVPVSGPSIDFYQNNGEHGITRGKVSPQNYRIEVKDGKAQTLQRGQDEWDFRKREKIVLWKKFANYMTANGRDVDYPYDDALARTWPEQNTPEKVVAGNVVTFYQRFGDVGCWGFCDGHFQFNFPDHTKIVLSADGTWCDFYHLPLEAARDLSIKGTLPAQALDDRQHLSYPLQTLLNFMSKPARAGKTTNRKRPEINPMIQGIPTANDFRRKIEFIRIIVKEWVTNGGQGISDTTPEGRLRWGGYRELIDVKVPYKHVWVTVGGRNGDERRVAWFDPKKPVATILDIE